jgi:hypothetical protein
VLSKRERLWSTTPTTKAALPRTISPAAGSRRVCSLVYNWWNIFVRLADPDLHREAITSRPLFLMAIATRTRHARQTTIRVTSSHAKAEPAAKALAAVALSCAAGQKCGAVDPPANMAIDPVAAVQGILKSRLLRPPPRLAQSLMQPQREKTAERTKHPTAVFRITDRGLTLREAL